MNEATPVTPDQHNRWMEWVAWLTWALVAYATISVEWHRKVSQPWWHSGLVLLSLLLYFEGMRRLISGSLSRNDQIKLWVGLQYFSVIAVSLLVPSYAIVVLGIILASQLPWATSQRNALLIIASYMLLNFAIRDWWWHDPQSIFEGLMYGTFQLFAFFAMSANKNEREAKDDLSKVNAELNATQVLLSQAVRQSERISIARNLHDVLGHHLTALSIQLEIAAHLSSGDAKAQIQKAQQLSKLLLADVRSAVSDLRDTVVIDLPQALRTLTQSIPRLTIKGEWPDDWQVQEMAVAETILRLVQEALTNTLRHSDASTSTIRITPTVDQLTISIRDNGRRGGECIEGNGLRGMRERVQHLGGQLRVAQNADSFEIFATLPVAPV